MSYKYKFLAVVLLIAVSVALGGCPKSAYHSAVVAEHDFKLGVASFQQAEMLEFQNGRISPEEHQRLEAGVEKVGLSASVLVGSLQSGAANTTVQQNFTTVSGAVGDLLNNGVLGIKNPTSQQLLRALLLTGQAILTNVGQLLAMPVSTTPSIIVVPPTQSTVNTPGGR